MDVAFCNDNAVLKLYLTLWADNFAAFAAFQIARFTHRRLQADRTGVRSRELDLGFRADRAENRYAGETALWANDLDTLVRGKLAGLGKVFFMGQLIAFAKQDVEHPAAQVGMARGSFKQYGLQDKQIVSVKVESDGRSLVFGDVVVRVSEKYALAMHIDTDESNAAGAVPGMMAEILD